MVRIRIAKPEDAASLLSIYAPYVDNTAISFEYAAPSLSEFRGRMEKVLSRYPYILAEEEGEILGYAYAGSFHPRAAFLYCVETTVYLRQDQKKKGLGKLLYDALENILKEQNVLNLYACIASPEAEDEYLSRNSIDFHAHLGYRLIGEFKRCGYKFDRWYNMVWMEKMLSAHTEAPSPFLPFPVIREKLKEKYGLE